MGKLFLLNFFLLVFMGDHYFTFLTAVGISLGVPVLGYLAMKVLFAVDWRIFR